jgi:hypothetical protein
MGPLHFAPREIMEFGRCDPASDNKKGNKTADGKI